MLINPDLGAAQEIARILSFPAAFSVEPFAGGRIDMIGFQVTEQDTLAGVSLNDFHRNRLAEVLICAAHRGDNFIIPDGSFVPAAGTSSIWWAPRQSCKKCSGASAAPCKE